MEANALIKTFLYALICLFLFFSSTIFQKLFGSITLQWDSKIDIGTVFNILSAIATAIAAFAACWSAQLAARATVSSQADARMQIYVAHQQQFDRMLDDAEKEMRISFFRRIHLYDRLFPANRHLDQDFTPKALDSAVSEWLAQYKECEKLVSSGLSPSPEYIHDWMKRCVTLADSMNFRFRQLNIGEGEILWQGDIPTWFARNAGKPFYNLGEVLHRLATFGLLEQPYPMPVNGREHLAFLTAYERFYDNIATGRTNHKLG